MTWACKICGSSGASDADLDYLKLNWRDTAARCPKCGTTIVVLSSQQVGPSQWVVRERRP